MSMKKIGMKGFTVVIMLIVILGLVYYTYLNNNASNRQETSEETEAEKLLNYDFENNYPKTVRETVKLHCRYLKSAYNDAFAEEELFTINRNIRELFDEELLQNNAEADQLQGLKDEIQLYEENKQKFISYSLAEASQVQYNTEDGVEYAKMKVTIVLKVDGGTMSGDEEYILRKDEEGRWKILGWQTVDKNTTENEGEAE